MSNDTITVVVVEPGEEPEIRQVENELEALQNIVGGYIEMCHIDGNISMVCNEEGRIRNLPANRNVMMYGMIHGTFFFVGVEGGDFVSLSEGQVEGLCEYFSLNNAR